MQQNMGRGGKEMNFVELVFILGFIETVILFLYAIRWYIFTYVSIKSRPAKNQDEGKCKTKVGFVSVLLPIYNEPNVVDRLLKACTSFNLPLYEVVVVDDSNDVVTTEKLEVWNNNPKVKVIHRSSREGWKGGAMNVALEHLDPKSTSCYNI